MKCDWVKQNIVFYVYDELADDARYEFEQHIARCADCAGELKATRDFHQTMAVTAPVEPSPNLLAASRMRLQEALETTKQGGFLSKVLFDPAVWLRQMRFSPALATVLFLVGFGGGIGTMYQVGATRRTDVGTVVNTSSPDQAGVANIRSVTQEPGTNRVNIQYDTVTTQQAEGSLNDQRIQQLLLFAARNNYNAGVRVDSVGLLTQQPHDERVRQALAYALRYDSNPGVRLKALEGLGQFVRSEVTVRDAVLQALVSDNNQGVRTQALHLLEPVSADSSVRIVLTQLARSDENKYIKAQARLMLRQLPEID
jgi:hypothetical protein